MCPNLVSGFNCGTMGVYCPKCEISKLEDSKKQVVNYLENELSKRSDLIKGQSDYAIGIGVGLQMALECVLTGKEI